MNEQEPQRSVQDSFDALKGWLKARDWPHLGPLCALLDAHLLFREEGLSAEALRPLFQVWWRAKSLAAILADLVGAGLLLEGSSGACYAVPCELRQSLAAELGRHLAGLPTSLPDGITDLRRLLYGFAGYCQRETTNLLVPAAEVWGGMSFASGGGRHLLLLRPSPVRLHPHPEAYVLILCALPEASAESIAGQFASRPALRHRLALYDLEKGHKINLTRSELFVHFERYLRQGHGLRVTPSPAFTRCLMASGLLNLNKG